MMADDSFRHVRGHSAALYFAMKIDSL